jgi:hypothetical protein
MGPNPFALLAYAVAVQTLVGSGAGAVASPKGRRWRGAAIGAGVGLGAMLTIGGATIAVQRAINRRRLETPAPTQQLRK